MEVKADARKFYEIECDALVVNVYEGEKPEEGASPNSINGQAA
ncbi:MAG: hypothetical protein U0Y68_26095 [Blastocatellia bacterium]